MKLSGRICNYLAIQFALIKSLKDVRSDIHRASLAKLIKKSWIENLPDVPLVVKTHCMALLHGKIRQVLGKKIKSNLKNLQRDYLIDGDPENLSCR
jgi:hypothetical protein